MTYSPLPWDYEDFTAVKEEYPHWSQPSYINGGFMIFSPTCDDHPVADCSCNHTCREADECEANAAFIVKAVNNHDKLVEALRLVRGIIVEASAVGFNYKDRDWAERLYASQGDTANALKEAGERL